VDLSRHVVCIARHSRGVASDTPMSEVRTLGPQKFSPAHNNGGVDGQSEHVTGALCGTHFR
jgi:hypothetical protein